MTQFQNTQFQQTTSPLTIKNYLPENEQKGYLNLILGPMFSGKSTRLIEYIRKYKTLGLDMIIVKPSIDVRYTDINEICTHNAEKEKCISFEINQLNDIFDLESYQNTNLIFIEEAQFFSNIYQIIKKMTDTDKKIVYLSALNGDSNRELFGEIYKLLPLTDNIEFLQALCTICNDGTNGVYSKRLTSNKSQIFVAGSGEYQAVCRKHFLDKCN
jgi:thymidine kinase